MERARRTAELAGFHHPHVSDLLMEVNYGRYEGLTTRQIHESDPNWELYRDGSPGGETPAQVYSRARAFIELATSRREGIVIAFGHGHILRAVAVAWIGADITVAAGLLLDVATVSILREQVDRGRVIGTRRDSAYDRRRRVQVRLRTPGSPAKTRNAEVATSAR